MLSLGMLNGAKMKLRKTSTISGELQQEDEEIVFLAGFFFRRFLRFGWCGG